jgi:diguanylate cyclase (GGDEF)-like protein
MRNIDSQVSRLLEQLSTLMGKALVLDESDAAADFRVISGLPNGANRLAIRTENGESFQLQERGVVQEIADLLQRDATMRSEFQALDQRLRLVERENLDLAMKNRALAEVSSRDTLTGLYTRWYILDKIESEMNRALRHGTPMSLLMIDIDHFKQVNDAHGHQAGDQVLQQIGSLLRDCCRVYDIPGRYGGEEFCLMLPETKLESTMHVAERIRRRVAATPVSGSAGPIHVTASIGVAGLENVPDEDVFNAHSLIERADRALYSAKDRGRNRVETWNSILSNVQRAQLLIEH